MITHGLIFGTKTLGRMDRLQKKVLDENLLYLQENVVLTESFYAGLIQNEIFTEDMLKTIQVGTCKTLIFIEFIVYYYFCKRSTT